MARLGDGDSSRFQVAQWVWPVIPPGESIRTGIGLLLGLLFVYLFDLNGVSRTVVLVCSSAPSGLNTLVFSSMEKLDNEFAASVVSYSVIVGMILIPLLLQVTQ